jgi:hypothetical protein
LQIGRVYQIVGAGRYGDWNEVMRHEHETKITVFSGTTNSHSTVGSHCRIHTANKHVALSYFDSKSRVRLAIN